MRLNDDAGRQGRIATVRLRWTDPDDGRADEVAREIRASDIARSFQATDPFFRFDAVVASTAEVLRGSPWAGHLALGDVAEVAFHEAEGLPPTDEVHAFLDLLDRLARMDG